MWCHVCQQDVPGIASLQDESVVCCARCTTQLNAKPAEEGDASEDSPPCDADEGTTSAHPANGQTVSHPPAPTELDDWDLDDDLTTAAQMLQSLDGGNVWPEPGKGRSVTAATAPARPELAPPQVPPGRRSHRQKRGSFISWAILALGVMTFVFGGVLLGWSYFSQRSELWTLGLPLTLAGQSTLLIGLVLQLDTLWQNNRRTTRALHELHEQLHELRHATSLLSTSHSSAAQSFYAHMAEGASPQLLMADLKGQLDLLALRLASQRRAA